MCPCCVLCRGRSHAKRSTPSPRSSLESSSCCFPLDIPTWFVGETVIKSEDVPAASQCITVTAFTTVMFLSLSHSEARHWPSPTRLMLCQSCSFLRSPSLGLLALAHHHQRFHLLHVLAIHSYSEGRYWPFQTSLILCHCGYAHFHLHRLLAYHNHPLHHHLVPPRHIHG